MFCCGSWFRLVRVVGWCVLVNFFEVGVDVVVGFVLLVDG